ncbi:MAG: sugar ABC transporter ATP-binding protein [bacterium]|nr:sugar ABC transporter ATP-binding protein [bacterium]
MSAPLIELRGISKRFGAQVALADVDFTAWPGEVHAIIGENGAGKSTLMKVLSGAVKPDAGSVRVAGQPLLAASPAEARRLGVAMIYQELTLAPHLSVAANLMLGVEPHRCGFLRTPYARMRAVLSELGHPSLPLDTPVRSLSISEQQIVEIARALLWRARTIIFDEPTSSLTHTDTLALFAVIRRLKAAGLAIIYISHFLDEVIQIADRCTVLRDGRCVGTRLRSQTSLHELVQLMIGRTPESAYERRPPHITTPALELLTPTCHLRVRRGEIVGIAGLVGSGRSHLLRSIAGLAPATEGSLVVHGRARLPLRAMTPARALRLGIQFLSENRKEEGLALSLSVRDNLTLPALASRFTRPTGFLRLADELSDSWRACRTLRIKLASVHQPVLRLSGGNQQKVALARLRLQQADILLLDEPTRGIDVGSKIEIYALLHEWAAAGAAIVMASSYVPELLGVCDTVAVMHRRRLSPLRPVGEWTPETVIEWATTGKLGPHQPQKPR